MTTASDIRALRHRLGWSQERLAEYLRVHQSTVSLMERRDTAIKGPVTALLEQLSRDAEAAEVME